MRRSLRDLLERWANGLVYALVVVASLFQILLLLGEPLSLPYRILAVIVAPWAAVSGRRFTFATPWSPGRPGSIGTRMLRSWVSMSATLLLLAFLLGASASFSRPAILLWFLLTPLLLLALNRAALWLTPRVLGRRKRRKTAVLLGLNDAARLLADRLRQSGAYEPIGYFAGSAAELPDGPPYLGTVARLSQYVRDHRIEVVFAALSSGSGVPLYDEVQSLRDRGVRVCYVPDFLTMNLLSAELRDIEGVLGIELPESALYGVDGTLKRGMDLLLAGTAVFILLPAMLLLTLFVRLRSGAPAVAGLRRYDLRGRRFMAYRFDRLYAADETGGGASGELLRRLAVAEWPLLFNVLRGDLSLVGPRSLSVAHNAYYLDAMRHDLMRYRLRPGLTGWAQIHGLDSDARQIGRLDERVRYDQDYIRNWSLLLDLRILLRAAGGLFRGR